MRVSVFDCTGECLDDDERLTQQDVEGAYFNCYLILSTVDLIC